MSPPLPRPPFYATPNTMKESYFMQPTITLVTALLLAPLAALMKTAGYRTDIIGKLHVNPKTA